MTSQQISVHFKNQLSEIERLGQIVAEFAAWHHLPAQVVFEVNLALEEILTNVISYAYADSKEHQILVTLALTEGELTAEVEDDGRPFDPTEASEPDTGTPLEERRVGGLGIHLARKLMDDLAYQRQPDKNLLVMTKKIEEG